MSRDVKTLCRILENSIEMHRHHMEMLNRLKDHLVALESRVRELEGIKANEKG